jgi:hypothetical protein
MHLLWRFNICLLSLYNLIESSPNDQNTPNVFLSIKRTNIYISSHKFVFNRSISMEVWFDTFPLSWWCDYFLFQFLIIFENFPCREVSRAFKKTPLYSEPATYHSTRCGKFTVVLVIWHVRYIKLIRWFLHEWNGPKSKIFGLSWIYSHAFFSPFPLFSLPP